MAKDTEHLADLLFTVGTYADANGNNKGRSRKLGKLMRTGNRVWMTFDAALLPPHVVADHRRSIVALGLDKGKHINHEVQLSLLTPSGKPLSDLGDSSSAATDNDSQMEGGIEDGIDF